MIEAAAYLVLPYGASVRSSKTFLIFTPYGAKKVAKVPHPNRAQNNFAFIMDFRGIGCGRSPHSYLIGRTAGKIFILTPQQSPRALTVVKSLCLSDVNCASNDKIQPFSQLHCFLLRSLCSSPPLHNKTITWPIEYFTNKVSERK